MHEFLRVIINRRTLLLFLLVLFLNITFCIYQCNDSKEITLTEEALQEYLDNYPEYLKQTQQNVTLLQGLSLYKNGNQFAIKNIQKTAKDYEKLQGIELTAGENRGITIYSGFSLTHFLVLAFAVFLVIRFTEEQKKGLHLLVRTTAKGRNMLLLNRIEILCICMFMEAFVLYGSNLVVVSVLYPGAEWGRAIQSVPEFMKCMYGISIGQYLVWDILLKAFAGILVGMLLLTLSVLLSTTAAMVCFIVIMSLEYILYITIIPTSVLAGLKYLNICGIMFGREGFINYLNLDFLGHPVELNLMQTGISIALFITLTAVSLIICCRTKHSSNGRLAIWLDRIASWYSRHRLCPGGFIWEARKLLIYQKGLIILILAGYLAYSAAMEYRYADLRNPYEMMWYEEYAGPLSYDKLEAMNTKLSKLERRLEWLIKECERLSEKLMEYYDDPMQMQMISSKISDYQEEIVELQKTISGLQKVKEQAEAGLEYMEKTGKELWLLEPYTYHLLLKNDYRTYQRNCMYILIAIIGAFSGCMAYENKYHMESMLHTLYRGRRTILDKLLIVACFSALTALGIHMIQFVQIGKAFAYHAMDYPVQSIECMRSFPINVTIRGYLCLLFGWRCLCSAAAGALVAGISYITKDRVTCLAVCAGVMVLPVFLISIL